MPPPYPTRSLATLNEAWSLIRGGYNFDLHVLAHYSRLDPIAVSLGPMERKK